MAEENLTVGLALHQLSVSKVFFKDPGADINRDDYRGEMRMGYTILVDPEQPHVQLQLALKATLKPLDPSSGKTDELLGAVDILFVYEVGGMDEYERIEGGIRLPDVLTEFLLYESFVTARGMWFALSRGMSAQIAILPMVPQENITKVMHNDGPKIEVPRAEDRSSSGADTPIVTPVRKRKSRARKGKANE